MEAPATTYTVDDVIEEVRDLYVGFSEQLHPTPLIVRHLERAQADLHAIASARDAAWWTEEIEEENPLPSNDPIDLGRVRYVVGARVQLRNFRATLDAEPKVTLLTFGSNTRSVPRFGLSIEGNTARPVRGGAWQMVGKLIITVAPAAKPLTLVKKFALHNEAKSALVYGAALFLAARGTEAPPATTLRKWSDSYDQGLEVWRERIMPSNTVRISHVEDVMG